jgi:hypothetical protein
MLVVLARVRWYERNNSLKKSADNLSTASGKIAGSR